MQNPILNELQVTLLLSDQFIIHFSTIIIIEVTINLSPITINNLFVSLDFKNLERSLIAQIFIQVFSTKFSHFHSRFE